MNLLSSSNSSQSGAVMKIWGKSGEVSDLPQYRPQFWFVALDLVGVELVSRVAQLRHPDDALVFVYLYPFLPDPLQHSMLVGAVLRFGAIVHQYVVSDGANSWKHLVGLTHSPLKFILHINNWKGSLLNRYLP